MEENRKITTALALAGAALLLFMAGYPVVKEKISEHRKKDVFLVEEQSLGDREEVEEERKAGLEEKKESPAPEVAIERKELPEVCFSLAMKRIRRRFGYPCGGVIPESVIFLCPAFQKAEGWSLKRRRKEAFLSGIWK